MKIRFIAVVDRLYKAGAGQSRMGTVMDALYQRGCAERRRRMRSKELILVTAFQQVDGLMQQVEAMGIMIFGAD